jgi:RHS repeat-associated protein
MIRTEEGFLKRSGSGYIHYIYIKDHLGNNRAVIRPDGWGGWNQYQEMSYYPFGMPHGLSDYSAELQPFKFGDKELDEMHGLKRSDHHARQLSSVLGIWDQFDPLSEARPNESPYSAFGNNPVNKIDPTGLIWEDKRDMRRLLKATEDQITSLKGAIKDGGLSDEELADHEGRIKHLEQSQRDVHRLESDEDNLYSLRTISDSEAHFVRQGEGNRVVIEEHSSIGTALHEVGHIRQSLNAGELKFKDGKLLNAGKTPRTISRNEVEAYQIQYSFNPSLIPDGLKHLGGLRGIDYHSVGNLKHNGKSLYPRVKDYSEYLKNKLLR